MMIDNFTLFSFRERIYARRTELSSLKMGFSINAGSFLTLSMMV